MCGDNPAQDVTLLNRTGEVRWPNADQATRAVECAPVAVAGLAQAMKEALGENAAATVLGRRYHRGGLFPAAGAWAGALREA